MTFQPLYKLIDQTLHYWEILQDEDRYLLHWGTLGTKGEIKIIDSMFGEPQQMIMMLIDDRVSDGFETMDFEAILVVAYAMTPDYQDINDQAQNIEDWLSELMKWTALGTTAGFSVNDDETKIEVYCYVVNYLIASERVGTDLNESSFGPATSIYRKEIPEEHMTSGGEDGFDRGER